MASTRKSNTPNGRPSTALRRQAHSCACLTASRRRRRLQRGPKAECVGLSEYVRRAVRARLGETGGDDLKPELERRGPQGIPTLPDNG